MFCHLYNITTMLAALLAVSIISPAHAGQNSDRAEREVSEVCDLDNSWTTAGQEKENGPQVAILKALASRVSLGAERTGFSESLPAAVRHLQQTVAL